MLANIFEFILQNKFDITKEDFDFEIDNAKVNLVPKIKANLRENLRGAESEIRNELANFYFFLVPIMQKSNGTRMGEFKELSEKTAFKIINLIVKKHNV